MRIPMIILAILTVTSARADDFESQVCRIYSAPKMMYGRSTVGDGLAQREVPLQFVGQIYQGPPDKSGLSNISMQTRQELTNGTHRDDLVSISQSSTVVSFQKLDGDEWVGTAVDSDFPRLGIAAAGLTMLTGRYLPVADLVPRESYVLKGKFCDTLLSANGYSDPVTREIIHQARLAGHAWADDLFAHVAGESTAQVQTQAVSELQVARRSNGAPAAVAGAAPAASSGTPAEAI